MSAVKSIHTSELPINTASVSKEQLIAYFLNAWELNEVLFDAIKDHQSFYLSPDPLRNPLIFYFGHTAAFYVNKLVLAKVLDRGIDDRLEDILAKGVDPDLPENLDVLEIWPSVSEVTSYRKTVKELVLTVIAELEDSMRIDDQNPHWALLMAIEHDRIHFETSSVLIRQLDPEKLQRPDGWEYAPMNVLSPERNWIQSSGGAVELGKPKSSAWFGWDNEYGSKKYTVAPFETTQNLITNEEYLTFFYDAYNDKSFWSEEGWEWKERTCTKHPKFWVQTEGGFLYRAQFDVLPMPMDWPVEVNAYEAEAYCNWFGDGARLLTEPEFRVLANTISKVEPVMDDVHNINFRFGSPNPVGFHSNSKSIVNDLFGNVWDWLGSEFEPLDGFEVHPYYEDFSEPYMDSDHLMMAGGAWITTGTSASRYYRLWFRPFFYQHAGFRLVRSI